MDIDIKFNKKQLNELYNKLKALKPIIEEQIVDGMTTALKDSKSFALSQKKGSKADNLMLTSLTKEAQEIVGKLYTNFSYASFLEFGTGTYAELPHIGTTKTFLESGYRYWYLPKEKVDAMGKEFAPQRLITLNDKQFYIMYAQQPHPFMRTTAFNRKYLNVEEIAKSIRKGIESIND